MGETIKTLFEVPEGYRSLYVARYVWQLDDLSRRLSEATTDLSPAALSWQHSPGSSTIGMLLAHIAVSETHITAVGVEGKPDSDVPGVIGIRIDDDGMPLPPDGRPPAALEGKDIGFFHDMLVKARANTRRVATQLTDQDLARQIVRHRPDGITRVFNVEWMLYHLVEHQAGHLGQILLLKHLQASTAPAS